MAVAIGYVRHVKPVQLGTSLKLCTIPAPVVYLLGVGTALLKFCHNVVQCYIHMYYFLFFIPAMAGIASGISFLMH